MASAADWWAGLQAWLAPLVARGWGTRRAMRPADVAGLIGPGERKSTAPLAERAGMASHDALHHFIAVGPWDEAALEEEQARAADRLVVGPDAHLIVDDMALPKKGAPWVGVAPPQAAMLGDRASCQTLVSPTLSPARCRAGISPAVPTGVPDVPFGRFAMIATETSASRPADVRLLDQARLRRR